MKRILHRGTLSIHREARRNHLYLSALPITSYFLIFCYSLLLLQVLKYISMRIVDTKGQKCPVPIIETRKALRESREGETFIVLTDNKTAFSNISRFLGDNNIGFSVSEASGTWTFKIVSGTGTDITTPAEEYCEPSIPAVAPGNYSVVISSELMGQGDDDLGRKLMKSFFVALSCLESLPSHVMFYNSGVKLTVNDSEVIEILHEIENKGVSIHICGTCTDFYNITDKISIGKITDMYVITQKLSETGNIIKP
jgi:selenium metabolism protein YedF